MVRACAEDGFDVFAEVVFRVDVGEAGGCGGGGAGDGDYVVVLVVWVVRLRTVAGADMRCAEVTGVGERTECHCCGLQWLCEPANLFASL